MVVVVGEEEKNCWSFFLSLNKEKKSMRFFRNPEMFASSRDPNDYRNPLHSYFLSHIVCSLCSLRTSLCLQFPAAHVASAAMGLAALYLAVPSYLLFFIFFFFFFFFSQLTSSTFPEDYSHELSTSQWFRFHYFCCCLFFCLFVFVKSPL